MQSGKLSPSFMMTPLSFTTALLLPHLYLRLEPSRVVFIYSPSCIHLWKACSIQNTLEIFIVSFYWVSTAALWYGFFFYPCHPITDEENWGSGRSRDSESQDWEPDTGLLTLRPCSSCFYTLMTYLCMKHKHRTHGCWWGLSRFSWEKHAGEADKKIT